MIRKSTSSDKSKTPLVDEAIRLYDKYGWSLFPVLDKMPTVKWKPYQKQAPDQAELRHLFSFRECNGIAVISGEVSGNLIIRDYDNPDSYTDWKTSHKKLSRELPTVKTGRGYHVYLRGVPLFVELPDGEYRGTEKQYTLIPPSYHPRTKSLYEWLLHPVDEIPWIGNPESAGIIPSISDNSSIFLPLSPLLNISPESSSSSSPSSPTAREIGNVSRKIDPFLWKRVKRLVKKHQPKRVGIRHRKLFDLAQAIKGLPFIWTETELRSVFQDWWREARYVVGTKEELLSEREFKEAFFRCRLPGGMDWERIKEDAEMETLPEMAKDYNPKVQYLISLCSNLQRVNGGQSFYLSIEDASGLLGCSSEAARLSLKMLMQEGLLERLEVGSNITGKASVYRYLGGVQ